MLAIAALSAIWTAPTAQSRPPLKGNVRTAVPGDVFSANGQDPGIGALLTCRHAVANASGAPLDATRLSADCDRQKQLAQQNGAPALRGQVSACFAILDRARAKLREAQALYASQNTREGRKRHAEGNAAITKGDDCINRIGDQFAAQGSGDGRATGGTGDASSSGSSTTPRDGGAAGGRTEGGTSDRQRPPTWPGGSDSGGRNPCYPGTTYYRDKIPPGCEGGAGSRPIPTNDPVPRAALSGDRYTILECKMAEAIAASQQTCGRYGPNEVICQSMSGATYNPVTRRWEIGAGGGAASGRVSSSPPYAGQVRVTTPWRTKTAVYAIPIQRSDDPSKTRLSRLRVTVVNHTAEMGQRDPCTGGIVWTTEGTPNPVGDLDYAWAMVRINFKGDGRDWLELTGLRERDKSIEFDVQQLDAAGVKRFAPLRP